MIHSNNDLTIKVRTDTYDFTSVNGGIQVRKNGVNLFHVRTVKRALELVQNCSTMGDTVNFTLIGIPVESLYN